MLSLIVALFLVPFSNSMARDGDNGDCDYDLTQGAVFVNENRNSYDCPADATDVSQCTLQNNRVIVYARDGGDLTEVQRVESGGYGNDAGIITSGQFSTIISSDYVLMINAGADPTSDSNAGSVSAFKIGKCGVTHTDTKSTVGAEPRAVTRDYRTVFGVNRDLVATVNAGSGTVEFNGCPGLPVGFFFPTGITCGDRAPIAEEDFEPTSYTVFRFNARRGTFNRIVHRPTRDEDGDPAQISFINEGRQLIISQRNTFFALTPPGTDGGMEDDIIEVVKLRLNGTPRRDASGFARSLATMLGYTNPDDIAPRFTNPVVSETTGNDNFGFSVFPRSGRDYNDCVIMTHGSFQQRNQGGTSVFTITKDGAKERIIPNKPDGGSDTCWTAISRTGTLYAQAFFDSEISIRAFSFETCGIGDGGPPLDLSGPNAPTFAPPPGNGLQHRVSSHPNRDAFGSEQLMNSPGDGYPGNQSDFLYEAGGLDMDITEKGEGEYLIAMNARAPGSIGQNVAGNWLYPPEGVTDLAIYKVLQSADECATTDNIFGDDCRPGDLVFVGRSSNIPGSAFGVAAQ